MTEFWQNMQQCKTYKPADEAATNVVEGFTRSSIRIDNGEAISNMQRIIVRSNVRYEKFTSQTLHLSHKFMVDNMVAEEKRNEKSGRHRAGHGGRHGGRQGGRQ